jgi:H/ACA ribonucleoprotein complex subunit 2
LIGKIFIAMAKESKKSKSSSKGVKEEKVSIKPRYVSPIASPMADPDLSKKLLKAIKKGTEGKHCRRGMKEVVKALRKGEKGYLFLLS